MDGTEGETYVKSLVSNPRAPSGVNKAAVINTERATNSGAVRRWRGRERPRFGPVDAIWHCAVTGRVG